VEALKAAISDQYDIELDSKVAGKRKREVNSVLRPTIHLSSFLILFLKALSKQTRNSLIG
jgi:hypothetical protein